MLYKNDVIYELSRHEKEVEALEKYFHNKFPVKVVYPPDRIVPSRLKHNRLPDKPASISFDYKAIVKTDVGIEVWRYAENVLVDGKGEKKYMPKKFRFNGSRWLKRNDIELIYFLLRKSEYCMGGDNQGTMVKFMFEDLVTEAEKKVEKKALESRIDSLIFNKDLCLPEERLRKVASALFIPNVESLTLAQVKIVIDSKIHATKDGIDKFFDMVNADEEISARSSVQKAIDLDLLQFDTLKKVWFWRTEGEKGITQICKVPPSKTPINALFEFYSGNQSFQDDVRAVLISQSTKILKKATKGKGGDEPGEGE